MVHDSDFYTTRRPYRTTPSFSTYTVSSVPSRQIRVLPGLGKVHIVHTYDRIVPYVGHKRLTVVTTPPKVWATRPSLLQKEYDWIERKTRPWVSYSATNNYLNSPSAVRIYYRSNPISSSSLDWSYRSYYDSWPSYYSSTYWPSYLRSWYNYWPSTYNNWYNYWPYRSLRSYLDYWPVYKPLGYYSSYLSKYIPTSSYLFLDDYYRELKRSRIVYSRNPIGSVESCSCMTPSYIPSYTNYYRINRPLISYYHDYWPLLRSLRSYSDYLTGYKLPLSYYYAYPTYWPSYRYYSNLPSSYTSLKLQNIFDDETRLIRAQSASLLKRIHDPVPRAARSWPITSVSYLKESLYEKDSNNPRAQEQHSIRNSSATTRDARESWKMFLYEYGYEDLKSYPVRWSNDNYIHKMMTVSPNNKVEYMTYYTEPIKKWIGTGHLSCVSYAGDYAHGRRHHMYHQYEDPVKNDIQLLSYYISKFRQEKALTQKEPVKVALSPLRPSRRFNAQKLLDDPQSDEIKELREARAARLAKIYAGDTMAAAPSPSKEEQEARTKKREDERNRKDEEERLAREKAAAEQQARKESEAKREEAARKAELARQEELAAQAAAERAAELEKQAELARQEELAKQAEIEHARQQAEEESRLAQQQRLEEEARAEEERQQLLRLEEIARQAEEEREADLARQAEELAELARQEAELVEQAKKQQEEEDLARQQAELEELERQEKELAELERKERELQEEAEREAEHARQAQEDAERARKDADEAELENQKDEELAELRRQQAELDALEEEAKALEADSQMNESEAVAGEEEENPVVEEPEATEGEEAQGIEEDDNAEANAPFSDPEEVEE